MNYLAIDTSTSHASIALSLGETMHYAEHHNLREHAQRLLPMVSHILAEADMTLSNLDGIVLGRGPGSFTGLRIACSLVKGLAYPHDLPVYPVSSLEAIAEDVFYTKPAKEGLSVLTVIDARMDEVYWDCYTADGGHLEERVSPMSSVQLQSSGPVILAGVGFEAYLSSLAPSIQQQCIQHRVVYPNAKAMIRLVRAGRCKPVSADEVLPVYVRNQVVQGASGG